MFIVKRKGKQIKTIGTVSSYERARQAIRKYLRRQYTGQARYTLPGVWDSISRNPTNLRALGFRIQRVTT